MSDLLSIKNNIVSIQMVFPWLRKTRKEYLKRNNELT